MVISFPYPYLGSTPTPVFGNGAFAIWGGVTPGTLLTNPPGTLVGTPPFRVYNSSSVEITAQVRITAIPNVMTVLAPSCTWGYTLSGLTPGAAFLTSDNTFYLVFYFTRNGTPDTQTTPLYRAGAL